MNELDNALDCPTIREYKQSDIESHYEAVRASLEELQIWFTWCNPYYCRCQSYDFIINQQKRRLDGRYDFAIVDSRADKILGSCGFNVDKNQKSRPTMSYWVRTDECGKGIMKKTILPLVEKGRKKLGLTEIVVDIAYCNPASRRIAESVGAEPILEGIDVPGGDGKTHKGTKYVIKQGY